MPIRGVSATEGRLGQLPKAKDFQDVKDRETPAYLPLHSKEPDPGSTAKDSTLKTPPRTSPGRAARTAGAEEPRGQAARAAAPSEPSAEERTTVGGEFVTVLGPGKTGIRIRWDFDGKDDEVDPGDLGT